MKTLTVLVLALLVSCTSRDAKFHAGQMVKLRQTGEKVMVLKVWRNTSGITEYKCRTTGPLQQRRDGFFSADTEITRYKAIWFKEFELQQIGGTPN